MRGILGLACRYQDPVPDWPERMDEWTDVDGLFQYVNILSNAFFLRRWITVFVSFFSWTLLLIISQIATKTKRGICEQTKSVARH